MAGKKECEGDNGVVDCTGYRCGAFDDLVGHCMRLPLLGPNGLAMEVMQGLLHQEMEGLRFVAPVLQVMQERALTSNRRSQFASAPVLCRHGAHEMSEMYAMGGWDGTSDLSSAECFDPSMEQWSIWLPP